MPKTIHLVLTYHWFKQIADGQKTREYRRFCPFFRRTLANLKQGDKIVFRKGYSGVTLTRTVEKVSVIPGWRLPNDVYDYFGKPNEDKFFEIEFKEET